MRYRNIRKDDRPSEKFKAAVLRAYRAAAAETPKGVSCASVWNYILMEWLHGPRVPLTALFEWDTSKKKNANRIGTIYECIQSGFIPGLKMDGANVVADGEQRGDG